MKYTRENVINFAQALVDWCEGSRCADCPFFNGDDAFYRCKLGGSKPLDWDDTEINEEEPQKKIVPFDFSLKEDRDAVRGKWIKNIEWEDEEQVALFTSAKNNGDGQWRVNGGNNADYLLEHYVFLDTGKPVGKEVEE